MKRFTDTITEIENEIPTHKHLSFSVMAKSFKLPHYDRNEFSKDIEAFYSPIVNSILADPLKQDHTKFFNSILNVSLKLNQIKSKF